MKDEIETVEVADGKYAVCIEGGGAKFYALRYGQPWRDLTGDGLIMALVHEIMELRAKEAKP